MLDVASNGRGIEWRINGLTMRIDPRVRNLVAPVVEPELWRWLRANVRAGDQVLDVGSFLGVYAVFLAQWSGPLGRVLAFEPTPRSIPTLRRHIALNGVANRVKVLPVALGEVNGTVELYEHSEPYRNAIGVTDPNGSRTKTSLVQLTTIDEVCAIEAFEPTLLRMDVQGFERSVLRGARETIARNRGRLRIVVEVHPQLWGLHGFDQVEFDHTISELGLRARPLGNVTGSYEPDSHVSLEYL